jgi:hypothetical protein
MAVDNHDNYLVSALTGRMNANLVEMPGLKAGQSGKPLAVNGSRVETVAQLEHQTYTTETDAGMRIAQRQTGHPRPFSPNHAQRRGSSRLIPRLDSSKGLLLLNGIHVMWSTLRISVPIEHHRRRQTHGISRESRASDLALANEW